jgi:hypothetical protein
VVPTRARLLIQDCLGLRAGSERATAAPCQRTTAKREQRSQCCFCRAARHPALFREGRDIRTSETATFRPYSYAGFYRHRQGHSGLRGIAMSEPIKSQSISRRRLFWLAVTAAALAAPATILSTSDVRAQQSDQAPTAEPTAPKTGEKKKKKTKKKATPGATTAPASSPPTPPKQQ